MGWEVGFEQCSLTWVTLKTAKEPKDPATQGCVRLPPIHYGVIGPEAQPVALAEGRHLLAEEEKQGVGAEGCAHGLQVAQVCGRLHL